MPILIRFVLLFSFFMMCLQPCMIADEKEMENPLHEYFYRCKKSIHLPVAGQMCDTLSWMAQKAGDSLLELKAAQLKLDYYYFGGDAVHIASQTEKVKELSRACGNSQVYYFSWGNRLITFYIIQNQINIALYELNKMLKEAQQENYKPGLAECYRSFAVIYLSQSAYKLAIEYFQKEIDVYEKEGIDDKNIPIEYSSIAECAINLGLTETAREAIDKGNSYVDFSNNYQVYALGKSSMLLYLYLKEYDKAHEELRKIERLFENDDTMHKFIDGLHDAQFRYYKDTKQFDNALTVISQLSEEEPYCSMAYLKNGLHEEKGDIYWATGKYQDAAQFYREYIAGVDTLTTQSMLSSISEFNTIFEVELLQKEKKDLVVETQQQQLRITYLIIGFMFILLVAGWMYYIRILRLNGKLKHSSIDLQIAIERAEQASLMKSEFIRNISHEVRTPLNSIVGFSQVLSDKFNDDPETKEYADIISKNSSDLLRLVSDVLEISALDQNDAVSYNTADNINSSCYVSVKQVMADIKPGVEVVFTPSHPDLIVKTNPTRVTQILSQLLHNAAKFTERGKIVLSYEIVNEEIVYSIIDTGIGIPVDMQEYVFERFVKLDSFTQGSGLGLPLCRALAETLGGKLVIDKEYKEGCHFILTLPFIRVDTTF